MVRGEWEVQCAWAGGLAFVGKYDYQSRKQKLSVPDTQRRGMHSGLLVFPRNYTYL